MRDRGPERIALYVHIPFCRALCAYCTFNKYRGAADERYADALEREIRWYGTHSEAAGAEVSSLYIGGGTPTAVPAAWIVRTLQAIGEGFRLPDGAQITLEANPDSLEPGKLAAVRAAGVNRLSVGVQSFSERFLRRLGRTHRTADIERSLAAVREAGFTEVSLDLMYGLPGQSFADFREDLARAIASPVTHLSVFPMLYHPSAPLWKDRVERRPLRRMYDWALDRLADQGFEQYTPEDFTRSGVKCQYQVDIWQPPVMPFLGFGAGALSTFGDQHWHNVGTLQAYAEGARTCPPPRAAHGRRSRARQLRDFFLYSAKTLRFDLRVLHRQLGFDPRWMLGAGPWLLQAAGLIRRVDAQTWELTRRGKLQVSLWWGELILNRLSEAGASDTLLGAHTCS